MFADVAIVIVVNVSCLPAFNMGFFGRTSVALRLHSALQHRRTESITMFAWGSTLEDGRIPSVPACMPVCIRLECLFLVVHLLSVWSRDLRRPITMAINKRFVLSHVGECGFLQIMLVTVTYVTFALYDLSKPTSLVLGIKFVQFIAVLSRRNTTQYFSFFRINSA